MTTKQQDEIEQLKKELAEVKAAQAAAAPTAYDPKAAAEWADQMHKLREARMSHASHFHPADLVAMEAACPTGTIRAIAMRDNRAPATPSSAIPGGQQLGRVSTAPGIPGSNMSGWAREIPLTPPPGIGLVDRLLEVDAAKQRGERMVQEARMKAAEKE